MRIIQHVAHGLSTTLGEIAQEGDRIPSRHDSD